MSVEFLDYTITVKGIIDNRINAALEECAGELEAATQRNSRVRTGKTKGSFRHRIDEEKHIAYIGSNDENAIWEEFGTGEYALNKDGRSKGWYYEDERGEGHYTKGKKPSRAFYNAYKSMKSKIIQRIQDAMKGL